LGNIIYSKIFDLSRLNMAERIAYFLFACNSLAILTVIEILVLK